MLQSLPKIFETPARIRLLKLFIFNPDETFTTAGAGTFAQVPRAKVSRELGALERTGLIRRFSRKQGTLWQLDARAVGVRALQEFLATAAIPDDAFVLKRLRAAAVLKLVLIAGVFTGDWSGRVDLLIVADAPKEKELVRAIRSIEAELGKEVRYVALPTHDFSYRMSVNDRLVRDLFDYPHRIILDRLG